MVVMLTSFLPTRSPLQTTPPNTLNPTHAKSLCPFKTDNPVSDPSASYLFMQATDYCFVSWLLSPQDTWNASHLHGSSDFFLFFCTSALGGCFVARRDTASDSTNQTLLDLKALVKSFDVTLRWIPQFIVLNSLLRVLIAQSNPTRFGNSFNILRPLQAPHSITISSGQSRHLNLLSQWYWYSLGLFLCVNASIFSLRLYSWIPVHPNSIHLSDGTHEMLNLQAGIWETGPKRLRAMSMAKLSWPRLEQQNQTPRPEKILPEVWRCNQRLRSISLWILSRWQRCPSGVS